MTTIPAVDQCPAGFDWGISKEAMRQIRVNFRRWMERTGNIELHHANRIGVFASQETRAAVRKARRERLRASQISSAPGLSVAEVARIAKVAPQTVSKHIRKGWLVVRRLGHRTVRVERDELHRYLERIQRKGTK